MINTLFLTLQLSNLLYLLSFSTRNHVTMASWSFIQISLKNSELKTTHNTFRVVACTLSDDLSRNRSSQYTSPVIETIAEALSSDPLGLGVYTRQVYTPVSLKVMSFILKTFSSSNHTMLRLPIISAPSRFQTQINSCEGSAVALQCRSTLAPSETE